MIAFQPTFAVCPQPSCGSTMPKGACLGPLVRQFRPWLKAEGM